MKKPIVIAKQDPLVIGLVGEKGSGKETFAKFFSEFMSREKNLTVCHVKFSDLLKETLDLWSMPATRTNLQVLAVIMDQHFGEGTLAEAMYQRISKVQADIVLLDGVRWHADIKLLNRFKKHYLVYITADTKTRFKRISRRTEKIGEGKDFKQFMKEEQAANELLIPELGAKADFKIENTGSVKEFSEKVSQVARTMP